MNYRLIIVTVRFFKIEIESLLHCVDIYDDPDF